MAIDVGLLVVIVLDHVGPLLVVSHLHVWVIALPFPSHPFMGIEFAWEKNQLISPISKRPLNFGKLSVTNASK